MKKKRHYIKPEITRVELNPEDAVLAGCKTSAAGPSKLRWCASSGASKCVTRVTGS